MTETFDTPDSYGRFGVRTEIDGVVSRRVMVPGYLSDDAWIDTDISGESADLQAIAAEAWTSGAKTAYEAFLRANELPPPALPSTPVMTCLANLHIDGGDVSGIETATGLAFAFLIDTNVIWAFFSDPMPDTTYGWGVDTTSGRARVTGRQTDYIEITIDDPTEPYDLSIKIYRVF